MLTDWAHGSGWTFIYAPGAGSNIHDPFGATLAERLVSDGISVVRFQFPYQEAGRKSPDRPLVLYETWQQVLKAYKQDGTRTAIGGRSMGGRIASQVAAAGDKADALGLFAYPLHAPGRPDQPRIEHLPIISCPNIFCSGTRDNFGSVKELENAASLVSSARMHFLDGADHGFATLKASGRTRGDVWAEACSALVDWLHHL